MEERDHFIIRHPVFLKQNMQHFPFIGTNSALCLRTVRHSPAWMEVSVQLIVALLLLEAYGLPVIEILLTVAWSTVCLWHVKFFQNRLFSRRLGQQPAVRVNGLSLFLDRRTLALTVSVCVLCVHAHVLINSSVRTGELCVCHAFFFFFVCEWRVMGSRASKANKSAEPQDDPHVLWL